MRHNDHSMTSDLTSTESFAPKRHEEGDLNPAFKSWIDNVIVPALVKQWIATNEGKPSCQERRIATAQEPTVKI
jgi:hypothetical protein